MIDDSWPWKRDLEKAAVDLERRRTQRRWSEASWGKLERVLLGGAFAVRKLLDSGKISDEVESMTIKAQAFPPKARRVDRLNRHRLEQLYDLNAPRAVDVGLQRFCNQLVHSFVLSPAYEPGLGLLGLFVSSDRDRERRCLYFAVEAIIEVFNAIATDDIVYFESRRSEIGAEMRIVRKSNRLPAEVGLIPS
ncbi:MAG TPA: hypothetical protein VFQ53_41245 [Kofleriaceae bacterium]|nr:hypothetical protein [Kofleriaceae bacterium]